MIESLLGIVKGIHDRGSAVILVEQSINLALGSAIGPSSWRKVRWSSPVRPPPARPPGHRPSRAPGRSRRFADRRSLIGGPRRSPSTEIPSPPAVAPPDPLDAVFRPVASTRVLAGWWQSEMSTSTSIGARFWPARAERRRQDHRLRVALGRAALRARADHHGADDITSWPAYRRAEHGLGRSFQAARLWPGLTVDESVIMAISHHVSSPGAAAAIFCLPNVRRSERRLRQAADEVLEPLGLAQYSDQLTSDLSTGVRRLLELAVIIAMGPRSSCSTSRPPAWPRRRPKPWHRFCSRPSAGSTVR